MYMSIATSAELLIDTVKQDLPKDAKILSASWISFNFWPHNAYFRSATSCTGRFDVKYAVQQRLTRAHHSDSSYAFSQYVMMKEMAVDMREDSFLSVWMTRGLYQLGSQENQCKNFRSIYSRDVVCLMTSRGLTRSAS